MTISLCLFWRTLTTETCPTYYRDVLLATFVIQRYIDGLVATFHTSDLPVKSHGGLTLPTAAEICPGGFRPL